MTNFWSIYFFAKLGEKSGDSKNLKKKNEIQNHDTVMFTFV